MGTHEHQIEGEVMQRKRTACELVLPARRSASHYVALIGPSLYCPRGRRAGGQEEGLEAHYMVWAWLRPSTQLADGQHVQGAAL